MLLSFETGLSDERVASTAPELPASPESLLDELELLELLEHPQSDATSIATTANNTANLILLTFAPFLDLQRFLVPDYYRNEKNLQEVFFIQLAGSRKAQCYSTGK